MPASSDYLNQPHRSLDDVLRERETAPPVHRRALFRQAMAAAAAIGATAALPADAAATSTADDPLPALVDEYFRLIDVVNNGLEAESDLAFDQEDALVQHIVDTAATTSAGILAQLRVLRDIIETDGGYWTDNRNFRLLDAMAAGVERLGRGGAA